MQGNTETRPNAYAAAAVLVVAVLIASGAAVMQDDGGTEPSGPDVITGQNGSYTYTIGTSEDPLHITGSSDGSWGFDGNGIGPFNSFYALFSSSTGEFMGRLDPYRLDQYIVRADGTPGGSAADDIKTNNVMWVLPTVYWGVDDDGSLILSNQKVIAGHALKAYAHTVTDKDGKNPRVYDYIAYGVYEASLGTTPEGKTMMQSVSGANPENKGLDDFIWNESRRDQEVREGFFTLAANTPAPTFGGETGASMVWNFYQWELYKYCAYVVMDSFDCQATVGAGCLSRAQTGMTDAEGPYFGDGGNSTKVFIENSWGSLGELVGGYLQVQRNTTTYLSNSSDIGNAERIPDIADYSFGTMVANNYPGQVSTDAALWGWGKGDGGSASTGLTDFMAINVPGPGDDVEGSPDLVITTGCYPGLSSDAGISFAVAQFDSEYFDSQVGSRMAFAFDADAESMGVPAESSEDFAYELTAEGSPVTLSVKYPPVGPVHMTSVVDGNGAEVAPAASPDSLWKFDDEGYGPFGSFYALFDRDTGEMICHLNPDNLKQRAGGIPLTDGEMKGNVMWVLPTVYWSTDGRGDLVLTGNPFGGTPYAHTVDGVTYPYLAIGVYEGSEYTAGSGAKALASASGVSPQTGLSRDGFWEEASATPVSDGKSMIWNFYQWELYKYVSYAVTGSFDSQSAVGMGNVSSNAASTTGLTDGRGFLYGTTDAADSSKLFIENSWGSVPELVGGFRQDMGRTNLSQSSEYYYQNTSDRFFTADIGAVPSKISRDAANWGWAAEGDRCTSTEGTADVTISLPYYRNGVPEVGGGFADGYDAGLSCAKVLQRTADGVQGVGSRLAFVFQNDLAKDLTLTYDLNGYADGTAPDPVTADENFPVTLAAAPERVGYVFGGWCEDAACEGTAYQSGSTYVMPDYDVTLYAKWSPAECTVTIGGNGADGVKVMNGSVRVNSGDTVPYGAELNVAIGDRTGYDKSVSASSGTISDDGTYTVQGDVTFTGTYTARTSTLSFDAAGGTPDNIEPIKVIYDQPYGQLPVVTKDHCDFGGWFVGDAKIEEGSPARITADSTAVAGWTPSVYYAHFEPGNADATPAEEKSQQFTYGVTQKLDANPFSLADHSFAGWAETEGGEKVYDDGQEVSLDADVTLYALWKIDQHTISFDTDGGTPEHIDPITEDIGAPVEDPANSQTITKPGYDFGGWTPGLPETMPNHDMTVTAVWNPATYTLTFDPNGGECDTASKQVTYLQPYGDLPAPTREDYGFTGWVVDGKEITSVTVVEITADSTAVAQWKIHQHTIMFDTDGGTPEYIEPITEDIGAPVEDPAKSQTITKPGYDFGGWTPGLPETMPNHDMTVTAVWNPATFTLTFDSGEGASCDTASKQVTYLQPYGDLPTPVREGYDFVSWTVGGEAITSDSTVGITEDSTAVAQWSLKTFTVHYSQGQYTTISEMSSADGGTVAWGGSVTFAAAAVKGFGDHLVVTCNGNRIGPAEGNTYVIAGVRENVEIVSSLDITLYTVKFASSDVSVGTVDVSSILAASGTPISADGGVLTVGDTVVTATPAGGYVFDGWVGLTDTVASDMEITAEFVRTGQSEEGQEAVRMLGECVAAILVLSLAAVAVSVLWRRP